MHKTSLSAKKLETISKLDVFPANLQNCIAGF